MKRKTYFLPLLCTVISSIYGMEQQPRDIQAGAELLLHFQKQNSKQANRKVKTNKSHASNDRLLQSGKCPVCKRTFLYRGKPHSGNARRHYYEVCIDNKKQRSALRKKSKSSKKKQKKSRTTSNNEPDFIPSAIHQCQLCTNTFATKVRLNAHMSAHHEMT